MEKSDLLLLLFHAAIAFGFLLVLEAIIEEFFW
jgi:hypothetical protein